MRGLEGFYHYRQYSAIELATKRTFEDVWRLLFDGELAGPEEMARFAFQVNESTENIGARRLHTILEKVLDEISFAAPDLVKGDGAAEDGKVPKLVEREVEAKSGEKTVERVLVVDRAYVEQQVAGIVKNQDLSRYIL